MDSRRLAGALQGLSQNLGAFAGYEAQKEQYATEQAMAARRDAANKAFQVALYNARAAQDQKQFDATREDRAAERTATAEYRDASLTQQRELKDATLDLQRRQLDVSQQNADTARQRVQTDATAHGTDRRAGVLSSRLTATGRLIQTYTEQRDKEIAARMKAISADPQLMSDPQAAERARQAVTREVEGKYQPLIDKRQAEYDRLNAKFGELTGVPMGDAEEAATVGDLTEAGQRGFAPGGDPMTAPPAEGPYPDEPADPGMAGPPQPPVPNARRAPDGNWYVPDPKRPGKWLRVDA